MNVLSPPSRAVSSLPSSVIRLFLLWKDGVLIPPQFTLQEDVMADGSPQLQGLACGDNPLVPRAGTLSPGAD